MRHLGLGLLLLVTATTANAVTPEYSEFFRDQDLPSIQIAQFHLDGLPKVKDYQLTLSIVPIRPAGVASFGAGFNSASRLHPVVDQPVAWATNNYWGRFFDNDSSASTPLLRLESKNERLEIRPRRHSLSIQWSMTLQ